ncbi:MAG: enoyl-CoA hydratase/isomerase family protein [Pseudomonadota bacterium]
MTENVIVRRENGVGRLTLNRPDALHALDQAMCETMLDALRAWASDPDIAIVMIDHAEETRGFCAGGDIRMLAESGAGNGEAARQFFATEYRLNTAIHNFPKPYLAIMDGVTMGGGVGVSVHGSHRVATERTLFAMPETGIGLFPDVGGGWFLPRLQGELGTWLALTGARLKGADVAAAGIATHFVPSELIANLKSQIVGADFSTGAAELLGEILKGAAHAIPAGSFEPNIETLNQCFAHAGVEAIVDALKADASDWAVKQVETLATKSPRTLKVALRQLREGRDLSTFEENMINEYRIGARQVCSDDFLEGVRAVIVDKDHDPKWAPATLEGVGEDVLDAVFAPLPAGEELTLP